MTALAVAVSRDCPRSQLSPESGDFSFGPPQLAAPLSFTWFLDVSNGSKQKLQSIEMPNKVINGGLVLQIPGDTDPTSGHGQSIRFGSFKGWRLASNLGTGLFRPHLNHPETLGLSGRTRSTACSAFILASPFLALWDWSWLRLLPWTK